MMNNEFNNLPAPNVAPPDAAAEDAVAGDAADAERQTSAVREIGGRREGLEPTRYGDWEKGGRCIDF
jgi:hypothetical protein